MQRMFFFGVRHRRFDSDIYSKNKVYREKIEFVGGKKKTV